MATATSYTKDAIDNLLDDTVTGGNVNGSGELILTKKGGTSVNAGAVIGPAGAPGSTGPEGPPGPTGSILMWPTNTPPPGWIICDGTTISVVTYPELCGVLGDLYGLHSGDLYYLPNLKGRVPVGRDAAQAEFDTLGETGGAKTHTLTEAEMPSHTHTQNSHNHTQNSHDHAQVAHSHGMNHNHILEMRNAGTSIATVGTGGGANPATNGGPVSGPKLSGADKTSTDSTTADNTAATATNIAATATNQNTGGGSAHNNLQPYIVLNYIIKT